MTEFPNVNTILIGMVLVIGTAAQIYNIIRSNNNALRTQIISDYETRLKQVEDNCSILKAENTRLTGQVQALKDLPLKQMADTMAILSTTQSQILEIVKVRNLV